MSADLRRFTHRLTRVTVGVSLAIGAVSASLVPAQGRPPTSAPSAIPGSLIGTVLTEATERPLMNATVTIAKLGLSARTDSAGNFAIPGIQAGEYAVAIRLAGFESLFTTLTFTPAQKLEADFLLKDRVILFAPKSELERLGIDPDLGRHTFDERRSTGLGKFVGPEVHTESNGMTTSEMIRAKVPALRTNSIERGQAAFASTDPGRPDSALVRGDDGDIKSGAKLDCYVQVLLNGTVMYRAIRGQKLFDVNSVPSRMLLTAEYYAANDTPGRYAGPGSQCGTLVIWTRGR